MFSSLLKRYGVVGIVLNVMLKVAGALFGVRHLQIHRMMVTCLTTSRTTDGAFFHKLSFEDIQRCAPYDLVRFTPTYMQQLKERFSQPGYHCYGLMEEGRLACYGWVSLTVLPRTTDALLAADGCLFDDYTNPDFRGRGLHKRLITYRLCQLFAEGKSRALAFVDIYNRASYRGFRACGFRCEQYFVKYTRGGTEKSKLKYGNK